MTGRGSIRVDELIHPVTSIKFERGLLIIKAEAKVAGPRRVALKGQPYELFGEDGALVCVGVLHGLPECAEIPVQGAVVSLTVNLDISRVESGAD